MTEAPNDLEKGIDEAAYLKGLTLLLLVLFAFVLIRTAWISDDACITFRTVDNFVNGYGLRYNPAERVQTYTHPLWMFCLSTVRVLTNRLYYATVALSILLSIWAVAWVAIRVASSTISGLLALVLLLSSKAFVDYSTSGLENPLTHLLLAYAFWIYLRSEADRKNLLLLSFTSSLVAVNRLDALVLVLPMLAYSTFRYRRLSGILWVGLGFLPLICWEVFSVLYYGFPFPNTAYAKLHTGIPGLRLAKQGALYFLDSLDQDPLTLLAIAAAVIFSFLLKDRQLRWASLGVVLYLLYIVKIGGDFMSGRFFTAPFFLSVLVLSRLPAPTRKALAMLPASLILVLGLAASTPNLLSNGRLDWNAETDRFNKGIADERKFYFQRTGLLIVERGWEMPDKGGREAREMGPGVEVKTTLGFYGYHAGPDRHLVDIWGIADPLIARLPTYGATQWTNRIGHFTREIPEGYIETLETGVDSFKDRDLAEFYEDLKVITQDPVFSWNRMRTIWNMNRGAYDELIDRERYMWPSNEGLLEPEEISDDEGGIGK
ncbi:MAG: hypothetical protein H6751_17640 [Candidatus Omnitrophica bacterium]|nr:hypothetical protein [Candidatus Omnitrophota bacterium]